MLFLQEPAFPLSEDESQTVVLRERETFKTWISLFCREMHLNWWLEVKTKHTKIKNSNNLPMEQTTKGNSDLCLVISDMSVYESEQYLIKDQLLGALLVCVMQGVMLPRTLRPSALKIWDSTNPRPHQDRVTAVPVLW